MPRGPGSRPAKKAEAKAVRTTPKHKKKTRDGGASNTNSDAASGAPAAAAPNPKSVPAPAAVLMQALGLPLRAPTSDGSASEGAEEDGTAAAAAPLTATWGPSPAIAEMEVEVETKQGYLYSGKLALLDAHYNVQLHESLVRRARAFDFERAIAEEQRRQEARLLAISLQGGAFSDPRDGGVTGGTPASQLIDWLPRPRYIGTVSLRSNNVVLMRFVDPTAGPVPATATTTETAWVRLRKSFAAMAAAIKAHLQREKMRRRAARRRRLDAKKKL